MRYADALCTYIETHNPHIYHFRGNCIMCNKEVEVDVLGKELFNYRRGKLIQDALKSVTKADREFLISGMCEKCFDKLAKEEEE